MDDTQQSRVSDAGATRKRRSSILKSQRPPRTPFSELEFNVATPTDTAKSRRVSFSKRTGVAEFVTNEATTTWKNFYEEHNKSLESSGNDSGANASRQPIGHLGKRIFEQQFEEVEAVDFITSLDNLAPRNINSTIQVNLTEQLECTDDKKLTHFENNFELSAFTDHHSKFGADDLAVPVTGEMSGRIDVNYSAVESLNVNDDLDEIQRDLQNRRNVVGPTAFRDARDFSEYIEVDLNSTHVAHKIEESDMSITETIKNPNVNVSKSLSSSNQKSNLNWVDKENCIEELKVRTIIYDDCNDMSITTALSTKADQPEINKNNLNPFSSATGRMVEDNSEKHKTILFDDDLGDISITKPLPATLLSIPIINQEKTDIDINLNKSNVPIVEGRAEKRKTIIFDDDLGDLSMTKPIPAKLLSVHSEIINKSILNEVPNKTSLPAMDYQAENHRTMLFEDDLGDISMTKPISVILPSVHSDVKDKSSLNGNINTSSNVECRIEKRKTILFDDGDLSMTKPIPSNLLSAHSEIIDRSNMIGNFDMHKSFNSENKLINEQLRDICHNEEPNKKKITEKRKTILFDDDLGDLSLTKPIPTKLLAVSDNKENNDRNNSSSKSSLDTVEDVTEKRRTIMFEDDLADLSITKPIPSKLLSVANDEKTDSNDIFNKSSKPNLETATEKRKTILFDDGLGDLSMTKPIPAQFLIAHSDISNLNKLKDTKDQTLGLETSKHRSLVCDEADLSLTKPIPTKILPSPDSFIENPKTNEIINEDCPKSQTIVPDNGEDADMSITMEIDKTMESLNKIGNTEPADENLVNTTITKPISAELITVHSEILKQECLDVDVVNKTDMTISRSIPHELFDQDLEYKNKMGSEFSNFQSQDVVVYQVTTNETAKEMIDGSELQDNVSKPSDDMIVQSNIIVGRSFIPIKEVDSKTELHKPIKSDIKEEIISNNASVNSEARNSPVARTISKKSILHDLLDMSNASMTSGFDDKCVSASISSNKQSSQDMAKTELESEASEMFYITRDTESDTQSYEVKDKNSCPVVNYVETKTSVELSKPMPKTDSSVLKDLPELDDTKEKICNDSNTITVSKTIDNEKSDKVSMDLSKNNSFDQNMEISRYPKSFSEVDNTKQLLDMLSDLTEEQKSFSNKSQSPRSLTLRDQVAIENKTEPKRVSIAPNRQSIVLSREDLLNNISMAQAALQRSIDMEDSDVEEPTPAVSISPPKKTVRVSHEVVKTLQFEDESSGEFTFKGEMRSPLKKTAFGETSYMNEGCKANVIPSYLKDVSDGIKSLMSDLVKPMTDDMPFEAVALGKVRKDTSTSSTQIQANLYTSSQIDMIADLYSNSDSLGDAEKVETTTQQAYFSNNSPAKSVSFMSDVSAHSELVSRNLKEASFRPKSLSHDQTIPGKVLVFDHQNPLNNVLLAPTEFTEVHKYCPGESQENLDCSMKSPSQCSALANDYEVANVSVGYNMQNLMQGQSGDKEAISENQSLSKPRSADQSICVKVTEVKDIEVNTTISMKKNKELLESSSSLTLVGGDLPRSTFDLDIDSGTDSCSIMPDSKTQAPLKVIYKLKHDPNKDNIDSDFMSNDEVDTIKAKKRVYSPGSAEKYKNTSSQQSLTPKPLAKLQRLSNTPKINISLRHIKGNKSLIPERDISSADSKMEIPSKERPRKKSPRKKTSPKKEEPSITVQQLLTEFNVKGEIDQKALNQQILYELSKADSSIAPDSMSECDRSLELVSSFTSSKNHMEPHKSSTEADLDVKSDKSGDLRVAKVECDSSVNVVAKIDMLPFMGSHECEWASSGTDSWCFQLLHARLRLSIRLAHRHHNATRTRVRADTPVTSVTVLQTHHGKDQKNSVAMACSNFACGALQHYSRSCAHAGDVPALLRRGAAVARAALRWGRAMHDARSQLAYTLDDQELVLKVANIPLRCVWEVRMRLSLSDSPRPFPRAEEVRVTRVLDAGEERDERLRERLEAVAEDWGHVPNTVWIVFKYLKNKTPESEELRL